MSNKAATKMRRTDGGAATTALSMCRNVGSEIKLMQKQCLRCFHACVHLTLVLYSARRLDVLLHGVMNASNPGRTTDGPCHQNKGVTIDDASDLDKSPTSQQRFANEIPVGKSQVGCARDLAKKNSLLLPPSNLRTD